jgi:hypothetical protein
MNDSRRSFFKSLALLGAAAVGCPGIFIPKFEPVKWKAVAPVGRGFFMVEYKYAIRPMGREFTRMLLYVRDETGGDWREPLQEDHDDFHGNLHSEERNLIHLATRITPPDSKINLSGTWKFITPNSIAIE